MLQEIQTFGDNHVWSETHWRPTCLIGDRHPSSQTHQRPTCLIGNLDKPDRRPTCLIGNLSDMLDQYPMGLQSGVSVSDQVCQSSIRNVELRQSPIRHVDLLWVFDGFFIIMIFSWTRFHGLIWKSSIPRVYYKQHTLTFNMSNQDSNQNITNYSNT